MREGGGGRAPTGRAYRAARWREGEGARAGRGGAGHATGPRAHCGRGLGGWAANGPRPGVSAGKI